MNNQSTILICEDDPAVRRLIATILSVDGYDIRQAADVEEAIGALKSAPADLVILDLNIPGSGGGMAVLQHVRSEPASAESKALLVTGESMARDDGWGVSMGADGHLMKPFQLDVLRKTVSGLLAA